MAGFTNRLRAALRTDQREAAPVPAPEAPAPPPPAVKPPPVGRRDAPPVPLADLHPDAFRHGFLATSAPDRAYAPPTWPRTPLGPLTLITHPATACAVARGTAPDGSPVAVALIGEPLDLEQPSADAALIAERVCALVVAGDDDAVLRRVGYLGGRFVALLCRGGQVSVVPDCHGTAASYWARSAGALAIASHPTLVAHTLGLPPDEDLLDAWQLIREDRPKGTIFLPGVRTPYAGVRPVLPNCRLVVDGASARHTRFAPFADRVERTDLDNAIDAFVAQFDAHLELMCGLGRIGVSLTAGGDSLVTAVGVARRGLPGAFGFTYANPRELSTNTALQQDVFGASARAFALGLQYTLLRWRASKAGEPFHIAFNQTWPLAKPSAGAANAMYADLPHDFYELQSLVSETGTVFYRDRSDPVPSAARLAGLWASPAAARRPAFLGFFEEFIDYADFRVEALRGYDYHDHFYWEVRNSRWAAEKYQVGDLSHRVLLPFNSRALIETMLALPQEQRFAKTLLTAYVARRTPPGVDRPLT